jgi:hypothetical protein
MGEMCSKPNDPSHQLNAPVNLKMKSPKSVKFADPITQMEPDFPKSPPPKKRKGSNSSSSSSEDEHKKDTKSLQLNFVQSVPANESTALESTLEGVKPEDE